LVFFAAMSFAANSALAKEKPPEVDNHGLHLVHHSELRLVYKLPGIDFSKYDKVILVDAYVAFKKNWKREHNDGMIRISNNDMERIKKRVATEFRAAFTKELEKKGHPVVAQTETGDDVLTVRPAIVNLDIEAPDPMHQMGNMTTVAASAGQMTLYAEIYDSVSSQMIAKVMDPEADRGFGGMMMRQSQVTNKVAEDRIVKKWADALAEHMHATVEN
jgi:hypothetical protein